MDRFEERRQRLLLINEKFCGGVVARLARRLTEQRQKNDPDAKDVSSSYAGRMLYPAGKEGKKNIGDDMVELIEAAFPVPKGFMTGAVEMDFAPESSNVSAKPRAIVVAPNNGSLDHEVYKEASRLTLRGGCGNGVANYEVEEKGQKQAFRLNWLREMGADPDRVATVTADGDSMIPRIMSGDSVVVELRKNGDTSFRDGKVYLITYQDEWFIKRLFKNPENNGIRISSDNPNKSMFPDWNLTTESQSNLDIVARVIGLAGRID